MTSRGGPIVPDGKPRPKPTALTRGPNRTDLSALPGTPGTPLPGSPAEPQLPTGGAGKAKRALSKLPLKMFDTGQGGNLHQPSQNPGEPVTAGVDMGAGPGSEALRQSPLDLSNQFAANELRSYYPVLMRLASMPRATAQTKILAQRLRANMPVQPEQVPFAEGELSGSLRPPKNNR